MGVYVEILTDVFRLYYKRVRGFGFIRNARFDCKRCTVNISLHLRPVCSVTVYTFHLPSSVF